MHPLYRQTAFMLSVPNIDLAPTDQGYEVAFAGRSNAGKSSALNAITSQKSLARTSKTPGRTQQLNFFEIDEFRRFVDLPGYGYAKVSVQRRQQWHKSIERYFQHRRSLCGVFLLMDVRRGMTEFDRKMVDWCRYYKLPLHIALTKADKLKYGAAKTTFLQVQASLKSADSQATIQLFSARKKTGLDQAHNLLDTWLEFYPEDIAE